MDVPAVRYAKTRDGLSIAYWTLGSGEPIVDMGTPPFSHIQLEWEIPEIRHWYGMLSAEHQLVRFDGRGTGLSERVVDSYSLEGQVLDLQAVVDSASLGPFTLIGSINSGAAAVTYAARSAERVRRLVLWCVYARGSDFFEDTGTKLLRAAVEQDWHMFTEAAARARFSWGQEEIAGRFAGLIRNAVTPKVQGALMDALRDIDVTDLLPSVKCPTLVLHREDRGVGVARRIAALIPRAQLVLFEGGSAAPYLTDVEDVWRAISAFIAPPREDRLAALSQREVEVLRLVAAGSRNDEIAAELVISVRTVERHIANIYAKTGIHSRTQAASFAHRRGLT